MKPKSAKAKGRQLCKELKKAIHQIFPELGEDDVIVRSSGAAGEDLILSPKARGLLPVSFECKNVEKIRLWESLEQAESNAQDWQPVLVCRRNHGKTYAVIDVMEFLALLRIHAAWQISQEPHEGFKNGN